MIPLSAEAHARIIDMHDFRPPIASNEAGMCKGFGVPEAECPTRPRPNPWFPGNQLCHCVELPYVRQHAGVFMPLYRLRLVDIPRLFGGDISPAFGIEGYRVYRAKVGCLLTQRAMLSFIQRSKKLRGELARQIWSFLGSMEFYTVFNPQQLKLRWDHGVLRKINTS
jgi:hypothetical protein